MMPTPNQAPTFTPSRAPVRPIKGLARAIVWQSANTTINNVVLVLIMVLAGMNIFGASTPFMLVPKNPLAHQAMLVFLAGCAVWLAFLPRIMHWATELASGEDEPDLSQLPMFELILRQRPEWTGVVAAWVRQSGFKLERRHVSWIVKNIPPDPNQATLEEQMFSDGSFTAIMSGKFTLADFGHGSLLSLAQGHDLAQSTRPAARPARIVRL